MAGHDDKHDTSPPLFATSVPDYSETGVFYEKEDTNPRSILKVGIILVTTIVFSSLFALGFFKLLARIDNQADAEATPPLWSRTPGVPAPEPRLQATIWETNGTLSSPARDLDAIRTEERKTLSSYGWVDKSQGTVRIPIDEAMRLLAEREAAAAPAPAATPAPAIAAAPALAAPSPAGGHP